jgi:ribonuclease D
MNSEDIEVLKKIKRPTLACGFKRQTEILQAIENLIKENKELNKEMTDFSSEWLHKDKIRAKIEEYKSLIKRVSEDEEHYGEIPLYEHDIQVLEELLRG